MQYTRKLFGALLIVALVAGVLALPTDLNNLALPGGDRAPAGVVSFSSDQQESTGNDVWVGETVEPVLTGEARDLPEPQIDYELDREINPRLSYGSQLPPDFRSKGGIDPLLAVQAEAPEGSAEGFDTPIFNFDGEGYQFLNPPDTVGDIGKDHYIQMVNSTVVSVYDKTNANLLQRFDLGLLGGCSTGTGDPIVLYDHLADRWFLSEFGPGNSLCIFISQTPDPLGAYYSYQFSTSQFPDYPKYGVWPDAYYATTNESGSGVYALERAAMLAGAPATSQRFLIPDLAGFGFNAVTPADLDGMTPPPAGAPGIIMRHRDDEVHNVGSNNPTEDYLEMWAFHVDWANPGNTTFTQLPSIPIAEIDSDLCGLVSFSCFPQPGSGTTLDPLREVIMFRLAYRNFGGHQTLVGNLVTDVNGNDLGGKRWFELRNTTGTWDLYQEGTYSPDSVNRWMGAIAMDGAGNIALGYNVSDATSTYPGLRYVGRLASDPLGTMPQGEYTIVDGSAANGSNRYGDYSAMSVDPIDDCTFWFTGEYNETSQWSTRIAAFRFDACGSNDFTMSTTPQAQSICVPDDAVYDVSVAVIGDFMGDVSLAAVGNPGIASFAPNPVTPPANSALTISGAGVGNYTFDIVGTSVMTPSLVHNNTVMLEMLDAAPVAPTLLTPPNGASGVNPAPTLTWSDVGADSYMVEIATDAGFSNIVESATVPGTSYQAGPLNTNTTYFWRVSAENACGVGAYSAVFDFTTWSAPGDCGPGTTPYQVFFDDFESGTVGWTTGGTASTWALGGGVAPSGPVSGSSVYHADDVGFVSDQYLISPAVALPVGQSPLSLKFWNYQEIEDSFSGCFDGGLLEISTNGGATWTQLEAELLTDPYDGPISGSFGNPRAGDNAWCGDPQDWLNSIVDLDAYAGQTVQLRWVMATDSSVSHPGWDIDDVEVQSCQTPTAVTLGEMSASEAQSPVAGLPLTALPALAGAALAAAYVLRRRNAQ
ncbi:MAG: choice-of-anchor J domain-containing protein [Chloroflexota bacterium]|nr:choice-of-anchor J domain-containing protein [Chloroflexota bacterium]